MLLMQQALSASPSSSAAAAAAAPVPHVLLAFSDNCARAGSSVAGHVIVLTKQQLQVHRSCIISQ
jgi:hypothetical protein